MCIRFTVSKMQFKKGETAFQLCYRAVLWPWISRRDPAAGTLLLLPERAGLAPAWVPPTPALCSRLQGEHRKKARGTKLRFHRRHGGDSKSASLAWIPKQLHYRNTKWDFSFITWTFLKNPSGWKVTQNHMISQFTTNKLSKVALLLGREIKGHSGATFP